MCLPWPYRLSNFGSPWRLVQATMTEALLFLRHTKRPLTYQSSPVTLDENLSVWISITATITLLYPLDGFFLLRHSHGSKSFENLFIMNYFSYFLNGQIFHAMSLYMGNTMDTFLTIHATLTGSIYVLYSFSCFELKQFPCWPNRNRIYGRF